MPDYDGAWEDQVWMPIAARQRFWAKNQGISLDDVRYLIIPEYIAIEF